MNRAYLILAISWGLPAQVWGQTLEQRLAAVGSGTLRLSFAGRPGLCENANHNLRLRPDSDEWEPDCGAPLVRVALRVDQRQIVGIRTYVGGRWRTNPSARDLGTVRPQDAAAFFLKLAWQAGDLSGDPVLPATLADSVIIWPSLLEIARSARMPEERRRSAVFWLGQAAGVAAASALDSIAADDRGDREIRKHAVFALSQRSADEAVPALIHIARTNPDPELRRTALFWLGQSEDSRALDLFEEILR